MALWWFHQENEWQHCIGLVIAAGLAGRAALANGLGKREGFGVWSRVGLRTVESLFISHDGEYVGKTDMADKFTIMVTTINYIMVNILSNHLIYGTVILVEPFF